MTIQARPLIRGLCLLAGLISTSLAHADEAKPGCQYTQLAELPLNYTGIGLQVTTNGIINGAPAVMLVDTGASGVSLARPLVERLDLQMNMTGQYSEGIGGMARLYEARLDEFRVGPAKSSKGWFRVIADTGASPQFDAIAGTTFLLQADLELSLAEKKMRFFRGKDCQKAFLGYWGGNVFEIPFDRRPDDRNHMPHFTIEINGKEMDAIIDSGAVNTSIMASAAKRAGLKVDAPGSKRLGSFVGVGSDIVENWSTEIDTLKIGGETIRGARINVLETAADVDVLIGDDYLRAHRVLFAMGQQKLYISYLGGEPLQQQTTIEPWMLKEADSGNADAQFVVGTYYATGRGVPQDREKANAWIRRAADAGQPEANMDLARRLLAAKRPADAAARLRQILDKHPSERDSALLLYTARVQTGEQDLGKRELQTAFGRDDKWPAPIADFYLGRIDAAALQKAAASDSARAKARSCSAAIYMTALYDAQGEQDKWFVAKREAGKLCAPAPKGT